MSSSGWKLQRPAGAYLLFGVWFSRESSPYWGERVDQVTLGFGRWKIQAVKVVP